VRAAALCAVALAAASPAGAIEVLVYTALDPDQLRAYARSCGRAHPDIDLRFVRDSNGPITARLLAERDRPRADVVLGVAASSMEIFKAEGLLVPYAPRGLEALDRRLVDPQSPPSWVGMNAFTAVICYNVAEGARRNLRPPMEWDDLTRPEYKGQVMMSDPSTSGTAFLSVTSWLQDRGEAAGWRFMDRLHANIARYTYSGSRSCILAAEGEVVAGISFDARGIDLKAGGAPIELVFPPREVGWDIEASAIVKGTSKLEAAKRVMDWAASREANEEYAKNYPIVAHRAVKPSHPEAPADLDRRLAGHDFAWSARNRAAIVAEWKKRYGAKSGE
jgi:iron(III) transport system substrate-binding protein